MFKARRLLFFYVETPLHVGAGRASANVDLPIQRERVTQYPMVQASSLKGALRAEFRQAHQLNDDDALVEAIFGKAGSTGENWAGAISAGDARILLFPVRSLAGVFAWVTSLHALESFRRSAELAGQSVSWNVPQGGPEGTAAWVGSKSQVAPEGKVVLEEFSFDARPKSEVDAIAQWLAANALPQGTAFQYWRETLPARLCILHEDAFRDFCLYATEVQTHIRIDPEKKTVAEGALWTAESLPADSLLYAPLMAMDVRNGKDQMPADEVLKEFDFLQDGHVQLGGDETTGQGWVAVKVYGG
ncbi:CRISPR type III-B/RAMP module RAMP protein Cmr4 [Anaerolinea thermolimosa]|uniref:CRISPR type III-B/RAMP module RAMP protein Cmr4 n=1 Tax=Anaerolinea thermolimosa TaxID=229919 RepID=A0A7U9PUY3_9CHLR|nr:type III-B CRISPR module RAMP protein Cmr4 [Anaerolinea thermolimosa]GAP08580.1 CRISPR type III-B/RAMP module RAMP protein Cmr4 [Anaerolinea thermolimosa]